jgi:hypothetical protein
MLCKPVQSLEDNYVEGGFINGTSQQTLLDWSDRRRRNMQDKVAPVEEKSIQKSVGNSEKKRIRGRHE